MNQKLLIIFILFLISGSIFACRFSGGSSPIQIRVKNETGQPIDNFWVGDHGFSDLEIGETSRYRGFGSEISEYRKSNFVIDGDRYTNVLIPNSFTELAPGNYTFIIRLSGSEAILSVQKEN